MFSIIHLKECQIWNMKNMLMKKINLLEKRKKIDKCIDKHETYDMDESE